MRKLLVLLSCACICMTLTACELPIDLPWLVSSDKVLSDSLKTMTEDIGAPMSQATVEAARGVKSAQESLANGHVASNIGEVFQSIVDPTICMPWNKDKQEAKLTESLSRSMDMYSIAKASDPVFQSFLQSKGEKATVENAQNVKQYLPMIIVAVIVVVVLLVVLLLLKSKGEKKPKPVVQESPPVQESLPEPESDPNRTGQFDIDYESLLQKNCDKVGLNTEEVARAFGGDHRKAYERTNVMIGKGMSPDEIMQNIRK